ncbi:MAG: NAD-dependent epimerase/dehydratase family protein [Chloroflexi bacterium]|nr:NAD-dependent epimerase/dehydratase family protein [Chloroflexota bacterium]
MRVIITGGTGLIGRALTASLAQDSHEVIVLSRKPKAVKRLPKSARAEKWDGQS